MLPQDMFSWQTLILSVCILWNAPVSVPSECFKAMRWLGMLRLRKWRPVFLETSVLPYRLFSLSQSLPPPNNQNNLKSLSFLNKLPALLMYVSDWPPTHSLHANNCGRLLSHEARALNAARFLFCFVRYTLDEFGTARRSAVVRGFIDALTRGGLGGTPRPIEMHSHDPMRYHVMYDLNVAISYSYKTKRKNQFGWKIKYFFQYKLKLEKLMDASSHLCLEFDGMLLNDEFSLAQLKDAHEIRDDLPFKIGTYTVMHAPKMNGYWNLTTSCYLCTCTVANFTFIKQFIKLSTCFPFTCGHNQSWWIHIPCISFVKFM